jgi:hypothetical protein
VPLIDPLLETIPLFPVDELFPLAMPLLDPLVLDNVVPFDKTLFVLSTIGVITGIADVDGAFVVFKVVLIDVGWFVVGVVVGCFVGVVGFVVVDVVVGVVIFVVVAGEVVPIIAEIYYMYLYILYVRCA